MMKIRKGNKKDSKRILELLNSDTNLYGAKADMAVPRDVKQYLSGTHEVYVCKLDGEICGVIISQFYKIAKFIHLDYLAVDRNYKKRGIATKLIRHLEGIAKKRKFVLIELVTKQQNSKMKKFMKKINYPFGGNYLFYYKELK